MQESRTPKKPRLVFTDIQRRTLHAIFKETKRPSKEMQATIAQQLGLEVTTVANFFMNARRRSLDKWRDDDGNNNRESVSKTSWRRLLSVYQISLHHWIFIYLYVSFSDWVKKQQHWFLRCEETCVITFTQLREYLFKVSVHVLVFYFFEGFIFLHI